MEMENHSLFCEGKFHRKHFQNCSKNVSGFSTLKRLVSLWNTTKEKMRKNGLNYTSVCTRETIIFKSCYPGNCSKVIK